MKKTVIFVHMFDKFFDCLNVTNFVAGKHSRKAFRTPYHSENDFRNKVTVSVYTYVFADVIVGVIIGELSEPSVERWIGNFVLLRMPVFGCL